MGYTHYFPRKRGITDEEWSNITKATKEALALVGSPQHNVKLVREYDEPDTTPEINEADIRFNGLGEEGHETFYLSRTSQRRGYEGRDYPFGFNFCKTARKPYDLAVTAVLAICHYYAKGGWGIGSDGESEDWDDGMRLATAAIFEAEHPNHSAGGLLPVLELPFGDHEDEVA